jgi:hypothetical protein
MKANTEPGYRWVGFAFLAWISMVGILAVMAAVKWNQPGFQDPDMSGPFELALLVTMSMFVPLALAAGLFLAPLAWIADRILRGRLTRGANTIIGAMLAVPAAVLFFAAGWLIFGNGPRVIENIRRSPDIAVGFLTIFAAGGVIMSLGMRQRPTASGQ